MIKGWILSILWLCIWGLPAHAQALPEGVLAQLKRLSIAPNHLSVHVLRLDERVNDVQPRTLLTHEAQIERSPASLMKLLTTQVALERLGAEYTWKTQIYRDGVLHSNGLLEGNVYIKGTGDPKITLEMAWRMVQKIQAFGIQKIQGDLVIDKSAFESMSEDPGAFDDEPLKPYNVMADALLINFDAMMLTFTPDVKTQQAHVQLQPPLAGVRIQSLVPLSDAPCTDPRGALRANFSDPLVLDFKGVYPASCAEKTWPLAFARPKEFTQRALLGMWNALGGSLSGRVREGKVPSGLRALWQESSGTLAQHIRDMNKFSNNVMAQQIFLSLSLSESMPASFAQSRQVVQNWWKEQMPPDLPLPVLDKGSGLSRTESMSAGALAQLLWHAWRSTWMPEFMASLPILGRDGTLSKNTLAVQARLKTGSLRDVLGVAGYVQSASGLCILVAIVNDPKAQSARPVMDALVQWVSEH